MVHLKSQPSLVSRGRDVDPGSEQRLTRKRASTGVRSAGSRLRTVGGEGEVVVAAALEALGHAAEVVPGQRLRGRGHGALLGHLLLAAFVQPLAHSFEPQRRHVALHHQSPQGLSCPVRTPHWTYELLL